MAKKASKSKSSTKAKQKTPATKKARPQARPTARNRVDPATRPRKGRVVTSKQGWGLESREIAPEPAPPEPVIVPEGDEAVKALRELGELNDLALVAKARWSDSAARTKDLKARYDEAVEAVQARLKKATHPPALPLFDAAEAEDDRRKMAAGPEVVEEPTESTQGETSEEGSTLGVGEAPEVF